jgi:kinesin family protein 1
VYLTNLLHGTPLVHKVAIVNDRGDVKGYLRVTIQPVAKGSNLCMYAHSTNAEQLEEPPTPTQKVSGSTKAVRQIAKLHFREDDFVKRRLEKELSSPTIGGDPDERTDGKNGGNRQQLTANAAKKAPFALDFPAHMREGDEFHFRVTVQQAIDVSSEYADVFCQFK